MSDNPATKGKRMLLSDALLAEVKLLIAARLGLDEDSFDLGVSVSTNFRETGEHHTESRTESRSWGWSESIGTSITTTATEDEQHGR
jgi:hypothetical protein